MNHDIITLSNGIRIVFQYQVSPVTHACVLINAGARDEMPGKYGVAHFIEHLLFKKTEKRSTHQILNHLESVGGDLNAYTTKEYTCVHASFLRQYLGKALDLFEDILFHSTFPENELEKEKSVIVDEMASYLDSPEESIMDDFEDLVFQNSGLGHNILGLEDQLLKLSKEDVQQFIHQNYDTHEIVVGISGEYSLKEIERLATRIFEAIPANTITRSRSDISAFDKKDLVVEKPINQVHFMLGSLAYSYHDPRKSSLLLLNNMLGGMGMTSILNLSIREKYGIAYTIESNYAMFNDGGLFSIYFGTDAEKAKRAEKLVRRELDKLCQQSFSEQKLKQAKQKFIGQIALSEENRMNMIIASAKNVMDHQRVISWDEVIGNINRLTSQELLDTARDVFDPQKMISLAFVPEN